MSDTSYITIKPLSYTFEGKELWLETGTPVDSFLNFTYKLPNGSFLFVPSEYVTEK